jgi:hypothetical protein
MVASVNWTKLHGFSRAAAHKAKNLAGIHVQDFANQSAVVT